jgi:hypothetical protein
MAGSMHARAASQRLRWRPGVAAAARMRRSRQSRWYAKASTLNASGGDTRHPAHLCSDPLPAVLLLCQAPQRSRHGVASQRDLQPRPANAAAAAARAAGLVGARGGLACTGSGHRSQRSQVTAVTGHSGHRSQRSQVNQGLSRARQASTAWCSSLTECVDLSFFLSFQVRQASTACARAVAQSAGGREQLLRWHAVQAAIADVSARGRRVQQPDAPGTMSAFCRGRMRAGGCRLRPPSAATSACARCTCRLEGRTQSVTDEQP